MTVPELYQTDLFRPTYRPYQGERWEMRIAPMCICGGYWSDALLVLDMAALMRWHGDEKRTWMSMTPMEIESQEIGCRFASGNTIVMGLGMGWAAANAALNPAVTEVTVVEFDPEVIGLVESMGVFAQLPPEVTAKLRVLQGDATAYVPDRPVETLLADIWLPLNGDDRIEQVKRMRANTGATRVYYWGQEMSIARRARTLGVELDVSTVARIVDEIGLPLIGPAEMADYPERVARAARRWLKDA
ncbi:hypothetical protein [Azospirillum soli]|uniref:hypothetical protein n=1 Tax=Azospirillum soli TaxID=1304799 RepID=UPI001AE4AA41|nr:hypothetical protein [Azospirillum soli]MBP2314463.1 hypothetical protein [Azospirillum soli]